MEEKDIEKPGEREELIVSHCPTTQPAPETGCFLGLLEPPGPQPAHGHTGEADILSQENDLWVFSEALTADFDLCIHPASIQLNPYHCRPRDCEQIYSRYFQHVIQYRLLQITDQMLQ